MNLKQKLLMLSSLCLTNVTFAQGVTKKDIIFDNMLNADGSAVVDFTAPIRGGLLIEQSFYGADANGFFELPKADSVSPLKLGFVKLGGNLHSTYNWKLDAYYDRSDNGIFYVYAPLELRIKQIQSYKAVPMFQINMLGWQADLDADGRLVYAQTATEKHAADAIEFINGSKNLGLRHILMGNEPFDAFDVHGIEIPSADQYIDKYISYAMALRQAQERVSGNSNDIKLWGPEIASGWNGWQTTHPDDCQFDGMIPEKYRCSYGNGEFTEFMPYFLSRIADFERDPVKNPKKYKMLDFVTMHYYPLFRKNFNDPGSIVKNPDGTQNIAGMLEAVNLWDKDNFINKYDYSSPRGIAPNLLNRFKNWKARYYPGAKLALTEFGIDSLPNIDYHPIIRPLYLADFLPRAAGGGVSTFINSFLQSGNETMGWEMLRGEEKTVLYNVFALFSNNFTGRVLDVTDTYGDKVNTYAVKTEKGANVFLINKDIKGHTTEVRFKEAQVQSKVAKVFVPAWSITLVKIPDSKKEPIVVETYGAKEMGISVPVK